MKWAGGKQALAEEILLRFPKKYGTYYEPFLGGGSLLLATMPSSAVVGDLNSWLVTTYESIRDDWNKIASVLDELPNTKQDFLRIREISYFETNRWCKAAYFIYLNKTCFRGLFRVNRSNRFNVPYGEYDRRYYDPHNLAAVAESLKGVEFRIGDFELNVDGIKKGDFVYFDPPYYKIGGYSDFNRYTSEQFREADQFRLAALCREFHEKQIKWLVSNSDTPFIRSLFEGFRIESITARRDINLKSAKRSISELLIGNY